MKVVEVSQVFCYSDPSGDELGESFDGRCSEDCVGVEIGSGDLGSEVGGQRDWSVVAGASSGVCWVARGVECGGGVGGVGVEAKRGRCGGGEAQIEVGIERLRGDECARLCGRDEQCVHDPLGEAIGSIQKEDKALRLLAAVLEPGVFDQFSRFEHVERLGIQARQLSCDFLLIHVV